MAKQRPMIGPMALEQVPVSAFSEVRAPLRDAWEIVGPSAERNLAKSPLWAVIAAAYLEGINHAAGALNDAAAPAQGDGELARLKLALSEYPMKNRQQMQAHKVCIGVIKLAASYVEPQT